MKDETAEQVGSSGVQRPSLRHSGRAADTVPVIPDHEIVRMIGSGAYGEVWLAQSMTGAYRAVKVVWWDDFEDEVLFAREFEGVVHYEPISRDIPGLVHILHVGQNHGEMPYYFYVMELADDAYAGVHMDPQSYVPRTLQSDMKQYRRRPMPLDYVLEVGCQLSRALEGLHAEDLTHRDVKPGNIIFINGRAKLADAGLVANRDQRAFVGTEGYIPPEGGGSPRADVYALAKVLYEMATGMDRLSFPALPDELPEGTTHRRWIRFNSLICRAAAPSVDKNSIVTAQAFAEQLELLRDDNGRKVTRRTSRKQEPKASSGAFWPWLLVVVLALLLVCGVSTLFLPTDMWQRVHTAMDVLKGVKPVQEPVKTAKPVEAPKPPTQQAPQPKPLLGKGQVFVGSVPSSASVYTTKGEYLDETPYGPVSYKTGQKVSFIIRKDGFADGYVSGVVEDGKLLSLAVDLLPYRPPITGQEWEDAQGTKYEPAGGLHRAASPVLAKHFAPFLDSIENPEDRPHYEVHQDVVYTTQEGISAFTLWLTRRCEEVGTIGRDHSLVARPENGTERAQNLCAYRLCTVLIQKTPITIYTNPAGAGVFLNGMPLGVTPMQDLRVPLAPYLLEIRLPGYSTVCRSGLSPKDLILNLRLTPNNSLIFGTEWINSLGMKFLPVTPALMAGAMEVRVSDYRAFCESTGRAMPEMPEFEQNEHHPVVYVSRDDAMAFADWLTKKEREQGLIEASDKYRLPTDMEWSMLVGCSGERGESPYERQQNHVTTTVRYPWGLKWPPHRKVGNYADMSVLGNRPADHIIPHYHDGFSHTAPVGSFMANSLGLHDLSGNVQEWVSDEYGGPSGFQFRRYGVTRGGDYHSFRPGQLSSHSRIPHPVGMRRPTVGFRLVLERR